jgi:hypothetical protein
MKQFALLCLISVLLAAVNAQNIIQDPGEKYAATITPDELKKHLTIFASDSYQGRETGTKGEALANEYLVNSFKQSGIPPLKYSGDYYQDFTLIEYGWESLVISTPEKSFVFLNDFYGYASANNSFTATAKEIIFLGYGIDDPLYNDYNGIDVKDKIVMVMNGEPVYNEKSLLTQTNTLSEWTTDWRKKVETATGKGVKCIMIIDENFSVGKSNDRWRNFVQHKMLKLKGEYEPSVYCTNIYISESMADEVIGSKSKMSKTIERINKTGEPSNLTIKKVMSFNIAKAERIVISKNVLGYIEGTDLKDEIIVVSAHYDHLGENDTALYNGADDDGSGCVALLEIAEAVMQAKKEYSAPRRSILFIAFSGEEKGLLGSKYYSANPLFDLTNTVTNLNIDMIGRIDEAHTNQPRYIYIIGSDFLSSELHHINEAAAKNYTNLTLDYTYNSTEDPNRFYYRSDHYNFAKHNIPVIFYFNGVHADYHKPTDDIEKINFDLLAERSRLVFHTLWLVANQDERVKVDVK